MNPPKHRRTLTFQQVEVSLSLSRFFAAFPGYSLYTKEEEFYCLQGRSEGFFRKMTLVFPCFAVARQGPKGDASFGGSKRSLALVMLADGSKTAFWWWNCGPRDHHHAPRLAFPDFQGFKGKFRENLRDDFKNWPYL